MTLSRLQAALRDPHCPEYLRTGFAQWLRCSGSQSLEECLELPAAAAARRAERDRWIATALHHLRYSVPRLRQLLIEDGWRYRLWIEREPPPDATPAEVCCFEAHRCGAVPRTERQLYNILKRRPAPFHTEPSRVPLPTEGAPDGQG
jgi:hypothetical protein